MQTHQHARPDGYVPPPRLPIDGSAADVDVKAQLREIGVRILDNGRE
jgi:hypothetical protein